MYQLLEIKYWTMELRKCPDRTLLCIPQVLNSYSSFIVLISLVGNCWQVGNRCCVVNWSYCGSGTAHFEGPLCSAGGQLPVCLSACLPLSTSSDSSYLLGVVTAPNFLSFYKVDITNAMMWLWVRCEQSGAAIGEASSPCMSGGYSDVKLVVDSVDHKVGLVWMTSVWFLAGKYILSLIFM
jgi:hypothetical protein